MRHKLNHIKLICTGSMGEPFLIVHETKYDPELEISCDFCIHCRACDCFSSDVYDVAYFQNDETICYSCFIKNKNDSHVYSKTIGILSEFRDNNECHLCHELAYERLEYVKENYGNFEEKPCTILKN